MRQSNVVSDKQLVQEVIKPILYGDIFEYPLKFDEIHRFLEITMTSEQLQMLLDRALEEKIIREQDGFYSLFNRYALVDKRRERWLAAQTLWPKARYFGQWIASLPFVRMVAVTGALAVENPRDKIDDIDYFIVTQPGRLWLCRALVIFLVRYGHLRGVHLCPNYLLTENVLNFKERNLFIAREMTQMVPLFGEDIYVQMRESNGWVKEFLPQSIGLKLDTVDDQLSLIQRTIKGASEFLLSGFLGDWLEKPLQHYQIMKHQRLAAKYKASDKVIFTSDQCKGHYNGHGTQTMGAYRHRINEYFHSAVHIPTD